MSSLAFCQALKQACKPCFHNLQTCLEKWKRELSHLLCFPSFYNSASLSMSKLASQFYFTQVLPKHKPFSMLGLTSYLIIKVQCLCCAIDLCQGSLSWAELTSLDTCDCSRVNSACQYNFAELIQLCNILQIELTKLVYFVQFVFSRLAWPVLCYSFILCVNSAFNVSFILWPLFWLVLRFSCQVVCLYSLRYLVSNWLYFGLYAIGLCSSYTRTRVCTNLADALCKLKPNTSCQF